MSEKITAQDVLKAIFARHEGEEWCRFSEVSQSTGAQSGRRADAVCLNIWPSKGFALHGFEIKVTRADFLQRNERHNQSRCRRSGFAIFGGWAAQRPCVGQRASRFLGFDGTARKWPEDQETGSEKRAAGRLLKGLCRVTSQKSRNADDAYIRTRLETERAVMEERLKRELVDKNRQVRARAEKDAEWIDAFEKYLVEIFAVTSHQRQWLSDLKSQKASSSAMSLV